MRTESLDIDTALDWHCILQEQQVWMRGVARARLDDDHSAEEIVQEVTLAVLRQSNRPLDEAKVRPWLFQLVSRRIADYFRGRYREDDALRRGHLEQPHQEPGDDAWTWLAAAEDRDILQSALEQLGAEDRQLLTHKYCDGWSYQKLCKHFAITERAVEYRLVGAKERLRRILRSLSFDGDSV